MKTVQETRMLETEGNEENKEDDFPSPIILLRECLTIVWVGWWASLRSTPPYKIIGASGAREPGRSNL